MRKLLVLALTAMLSCSVSAQSAAPAVMSREKLQKLIDESGTVIANLGTARNQEMPKVITDQRDKRGQGIRDDLQKNVMTPETAARLEAERENASKDLAAGDLPGAQVRLGNLRRDLTNEIELYQAIVAYWRDIGQLGLATGVVEESLLRSHRVEPAYQKELVELRAQLDKQIADRDFITAMRKTYPTYQNTLRLKAVEESRRILTSVDSGGFTDLRSAKPTRSCVPAGATSGEDTAVPRQDFPRTIDYFPEKLKGLGITRGFLEVFVVVNAQGCPERAILVRPAEYQEFDEAGLDLAVDGHYLPAARKPAAASTGAANGAGSAAGTGTTAPTADGVRSGMFLRVEFDSGL